MGWGGVDGQLIIDDWTAHTQDTVDSGQIYLQGGTQYDIRLEYYEGTGNATMQLAWRTPTGGDLPVTIPKSQLFPPVTQPDGPPPQTGGADTLVYLHADQLGSVGVVTQGDVNHAVVSSQEYDPWGKVLTPSGTPVVPGPAPIVQSTRNYTGQKLDGTGLLDYNARLYDPVVGRFVSPDSIVPGASSGAGGAGGTLRQEQSSNLTVDFHENVFLLSVQKENTRTLGGGFWFQLSRNERMTRPWGPKNPESLNRYSYALGNPLRYTDPTGHDEDGGIGDPPPSGEDEELGNGRKLSDSEAKELAEGEGAKSVEEYKQWYLGKRAAVKEWDLWVDKDTGRIYLVKKNQKPGQNAVIPTNEYYNESEPASADGVPAQVPNAGAVIPVIGGAVLLGGLLLLGQGSWAEGRPAMLR